MNRRDFAFVGIRLIGLWLVITTVPGLISGGLSMAVGLFRDQFFSNANSSIDIVIAVTLQIVAPLLRFVFGAILFCAADFLSKLIATTWRDHGVPPEPSHSLEKRVWVGLVLMFLGVRFLITYLPVAVTRFLPGEDNGGYWYAYSESVNSLGGAIAGVLMSSVCIWIGAKLIWPNWKPIQRLRGAGVDRG